jgi:hypothetical protein
MRRDSMEPETLACRCNQPARPVRVAPPPAARSAHAPAPRVTAAKAGPPKFCQKCGWAVKLIRIVDPQTKAVVERLVCTNKQCSNYQI